MVWHEGQPTIGLHPTRVMKITHNVALSFHPNLIPASQLFGANLDCGFVVSRCSIIITIAQSPPI